MSFAGVLCSSQGGPTVPCTLTEAGGAGNDWYGVDEERKRQKKERKVHSQEGLHPPTSNPKATHL